MQQFFSFIILLTEEKKNIADDQIFFIYKYK